MVNRVSLGLAAQNRLDADIKFDYPDPDRDPGPDPDSYQSCSLESVMLLLALSLTTAHERWYHNGYGQCYMSHLRLKVGIIRVNGRRLVRRILVVIRDRRHYCADTQLVVVGRHFSQMHDLRFRVQPLLEQLGLFCILG